MSASAVSIPREKCRKNGRTGTLSEKLSYLCDIILISLTAMKNTNDPQLTQNTPFQGRVSNGFLTFFVSLLLIAAGIACICLAEGYKTEIAGYLYIISNTAAIILFLIAVVLPFGLMTLEPNQARAMVFFGNYRGTFTLRRKRSRYGPATSTWIRSRSMTATATLSSSASY